MTLTLELRSISRDATIRGAIDDPLRFDAYLVKYYVQGYLRFRLGQTHLLAPEDHWPVLYLAVAFTTPQYLLPIERGEPQTVDIPEGSYSLVCHRVGSRLAIREEAEDIQGEVDYSEFLDATRRFAEDVRTSLLDMNPKFAEHPELGEWFRTPQA